MTDPAHATCEVEMAADHDAMAPAIDTIEAHLEAVDATMKQIYMVRLALDELLSNTIKYGYDDPAGQTIRVRVEPGPPMTLVLTDAARPFNPLTDAPAPVLEGRIEDRPIGGLGLHVIQSMGMTLNYRRDGVHNVLCVTLPADS